MKENSQSRRIKLFKEKADCCGCSACMSVCSSGAIRMGEDKQGFLYPKIDLEQCVKCGACVNVCPLQNEEVQGTKFQITAWAVKNKDDHIRMASSSGGVFYALADFVINQGGTIYGAIFDRHFKVVHARGTSVSDIYKMQGSKYVQSSTKRIFEKVKKDLLSEKIVLFTGCPCQIDGLKRYLGNVLQDNLITCDLICHGVNSPKVWQDYLAYVAKGNKIIDIFFRDKLGRGWHNFNMNIQMSGKNYIENTSYDYFYQAFFSSLILRKSCFSCKYANLNRKGDITIGDFWGIEHVYPKMDDNQGVSLVLLNSWKGTKLFSKISDEIMVRQTEIYDCLQPSLIRPVKYPEQYERFWEDYFKRGFPFVCKKYLGGGVKGKIKRIVKDNVIKMGLWKK